MGRSNAPTQATPDVELPVGVLGAVYLGGVRALRHARTGRITGTSDEVRMLYEIFGTAVMPHTLKIF